MLEEMVDDDGNTKFSKVGDRAVIGGRALQDTKLLKTIEEWVNVLIPETANGRNDDAYILGSFGAFYKVGDSQASHADRNASRSKMIRLTFVLGEENGGFRTLSFKNSSKPNDKLFVTFCAMMVATGQSMGNDNYYIQHEILGHTVPFLTIFVDVHVPDVNEIPGILERIKCRSWSWGQ